MHALVVEDDPILAEVWEDALLDAGFTVENASSCAEAVNLLLRKTFDVCLMDIHVTDGTTYSLADWVKLRSPRTNIIAVTGSSIGANGELATQSNYDFVFRKPLPIADLVAVTEYMAAPAA